MPIKSEYPQSKLAGAVTVVGDIVAPVLPEDGWESLAPVMSLPPPETPA